MTEKMENNLPNIIMSDSKGRLAMLTQIIPTHYVVDFVTHDDNRGWVQAPLSLLGANFGVTALVERKSHGFTVVMMQANPSDNRAEQVWNENQTDVTFQAIKSIEMTCKEILEEKPEALERMQQECQQLIKAVTQFNRLTSVSPFSSVLNNGGPGNANTTRHA